MDEQAVDSVTKTLAEWVVEARFEDLPAIGVAWAKERILDSLGVSFAALTVPTGRLISEWVRAQGAHPESTVVGGGFRTTASLAALANATAGHALEFDDVATQGGHPANPLTAGALAVGEKVGSTGRDVLLAWLVGWEVICQTTKPCLDGPRNTLLWRGWFNQGFQPALGVAAVASKIMGLGVDETRMALGNAASAMGGVMKNRGTDTKSFTAGNAALHGVMAAELIARGFTANLEILDGSDGVMRMMGLEVGDPSKVLDGLGTWDLAAKSSTIKLHASCAAGHWAQDAMQRIRARRPFTPNEIDAIVVEMPGFLMEMLPFHTPRSGLEAKYSIEYDVAAIALEGRAGVTQYGDDAVKRTEAEELMKRIQVIPIEGEFTAGTLQSRVILWLKNGEDYEEVVSSAHGSPGDPASRAEVVAKFRECSGAIVPPERAERIVELCSGLDEVEDLRELAATLAGDPVASTVAQ